MSELTRNPNPFLVKRLEAKAKKDYAGLDPKVRIAEVDFIRDYIDRELREIDARANRSSSRSLNPSSSRSLNPGGYFPNAIDGD
jgi:hypothetical protein